LKYRIVMEKQLTKFKLHCVYSHTLAGRLYTVAEKVANIHIANYTSVDISLSGGRIRHDLAYLHCIEHVYIYWEYIDSCTLYMYEAGQEIKVGFWNKADFSEHCLYELVLEKKDAHVLCVGVSPPLQKATVYPHL
jgi:hypothetical protein